MSPAELEAIRVRANETPIGKSAFRMLDQAIIDRRALLDHIVQLEKRNKRLRAVNDRLKAGNFTPVEREDWRAHFLDSEARNSAALGLHTSNGGHNPECNCGVPAGEGARCDLCGDCWPCATVKALKGDSEK